MITTTSLRFYNADGASGGGSGSPSTPPAAPAPSQPSTPDSQTVKDVWGGRSAPDWIKNMGLGETHNKTNIGEPKVEDGAIAPVVQPPAAPVAPVEPPASVTPPVAPPVAPMAQPLTADTLAQALARIIPQQAPTAPAAPPTMSEAELRQQLGIFTASVEDYEAAFGVKPDSQARLDAYNRHLQGIARQAVTVSQVLLQRALQQQQDSTQPFIQAVRAQEATRQIQTFYQENTDLVGYDALVEKEYHQAFSSGRRFANANEARKFIADQTRATLKSIGITPAARGNGTQPGTTQPSTRPQTSSRQMTTTSVGGRGGGSATPSKAINTQEAVWGKR